MERPDFHIGLDDLELVTGIRLDHLQMMMDGEALPSDHHARLLRRYLKRDEYRWMMRHSKPDLNIVTSRVGSLPEGHRLIPYLPARNLRPGDLIAHPSSGGGVSRWVRVDEVREEDRMVLDVGSIYAFIGKSTALRVARAESSEDEYDDSPHLHQGPGSSGT